MTDPRTIAPRLVVLGLAAAAAFAAACGPKNVAGPIRPDGALIVLLPDEDGSTGRASVSNPAGTADLTAPRNASNVAPNQRPGVVTMSEADVKRLFGDALEALPPAPQSFTLYFRFESDELTEESKALVPKILATVKGRSAPEVVVVGHTDTMGTPSANFALGLKRAVAVRELLVASGLDATTVEATSLGESFLLIQTPNDTPEPRNRRVEIAVK
jgi:outer membrane protein OmpA-like peptidoglycan-associated protein